jgi:hypothetical protein
MRSFFLLFSTFCVLFFAVISAAEQIGIYQHGTIVKMHMGECLSDHSFMAALSGNSRPQASELCPEYTLVGDKVVYLIVGRPSRDVLPLAQELDFRLRKNEVAIRVDDASHEARFMVREMILRGEWDLMSEKENRRGTRYNMPIARDQ